jgi:hypothetical protein
LFALSRRRGTVQVGSVPVIGRVLPQVSSGPAILTGGNPARHCLVAPGRTRIESLKKVILQGRAPRPRRLQVDQGLLEPSLRGQCLVVTGLADGRGLGPQPLGRHPVAHRILTKDVHVIALVGRSIALGGARIRLHAGRVSRVRHHVAQGRHVVPVEAIV